MIKTKNIILVSIIVLFIIIIIGGIFYGTKLTQKPAPIVEEKKEEIIETQPIKKIEEKEATEIKDCENLSESTKKEECILELALKKRILKFAMMNIVNTNMLSLKEKRGNAKYAKIFKTKK
jgi:regulatory protein YycI of two-component signal transduction system YycFG